MPTAFNSIPIKIVFEASLGWTAELNPYTVSLGRSYPDIEIESVGQTGRYLFKIQKAVPHHGEAMIRSVAAEAEAEIQSFWSVLAYLRDDTIVRPLGRICYEHEGHLSEVAPSRERTSGGMLATGTGRPWFEAHAEAFHRQYNHDLMKRFNFARGLADPVNRFLSLYSMLSSVSGDNQYRIDEAIRREEPTVAVSPSPRDGRPETIFTRLRNELAHHREGISVFRTHEEISLHVDRFEWLVGRILRPSIELT